jgi:OOP family OmpA-OmpF porin
MKRIFTILFVTTSLFSLAQSKKIWLGYADKYYKAQDYFSALNYYMKVLDDTSVMEIQVRPYEAELVNQKLTQKMAENKNLTVPLEHYVLHQIAMCYKKSFDYNHAVGWFGRSTKTGSYPEDNYFLGYAYMQIKNYDSAVVHFESYVQGDGKTDSLTKCAERDMVGCFFAKDINNVKQEVKVHMLDTATINKGTANFGVTYWNGEPDRLIYTSARHGGIVYDPERQQSEYLCDIWWIEKSGDSTFNAPKNFGRPVNTGWHEGGACLTIDEYMYFTRWTDSKKNEQSIFIAKMMNGLFFEAYKLDTTVNIPGHRSIHPCVSPDGTKLFFASDRPGGLGGLDIWVCAIDEEGKLSQPKNLGEPINTSGDEVTPFFHLTSSTLYFSSSGHQSTGGLDIFKSSYNLDDSIYATPVNIGLPFNSEKDDAYFIADRFLKHGYLSSDREDCESGHCYDIYEFTNTDISFKVQGFVYNSETDEIIPNALVTFKDVNLDEEPLFVTTDENGFYTFQLKQEQEVFLKAKKTKFFADAASINTFGLTESATLEQDFYLRPIPTGEIEIPGIEYDFNKATLRPKSKEILDQLYDFLMLNNDLVVEIKSHTDCRGGDDYNLKLSQERAKSCVDYLISKGIPKERLVPQGYGETEPLFKCEEIEQFKNTDKAKFEEMHQRNRRTAFRVTKQG